MSVFGFKLSPSSFWLGFLAGLVAFWLLGILRRLLRRLFGLLRQRVQAARHERALGDEVRLANDTLRHAQKQHLAAPLFSLDEVLILPRLLPLPAPSLVQENQPPPDITDGMLPWMPDWPQLAAVYGAPTLSLVQALQNGANLLVTGAAGSGKSVALAHLAIQVARREEDCGQAAGLLPILVHAVELSFALGSNPAGDPKAALPQETQPLLPLMDILTRRGCSLKGRRLASLLKTTIKEGRLLLLVDGLDEFSPEAQAPLIQYLGQVRQRYPIARLVATADPAHLGALPSLGLLPLPMATWDAGQRQSFLQLWSRRWGSLPASQPGAPDPLMLVNWLQNDPIPLTPLELTLKAWAAFAGDALGPTPLDAIEACMRRLASQPGKANWKNNRPNLEKLALEAVLSGRPVAVRPANTSFPLETENGLLAASGENLIFQHPLFSSYLAACALANLATASPSGASVPELDRLLAGQEWAGKSAALGLLAGMQPNPAWLPPHLEEDFEDPLHRRLIDAGSWLRLAPRDAPWRTNVLRSLANLMGEEQLPPGLRLRLVSALVFSGSAGIDLLLRRSLDSAQDDRRLAAVLGSGALHDSAATPHIVHLLHDQPLQRKAACLALTAIGDRPSLEAVVEGLVHGDEVLAQAAAEALANHPDQGHPTLEEAASLEDLSVRRAATYGLGRVRQPWTQSILLQLKAGDPQWLVQTAAAQALENMDHILLRAPLPLPAPENIPWLLAFAAEQGIGIVPGEPADELLAQALTSGEEEQQLAAAYTLGLIGSEAAVLSLYKIYFSRSGMIKQAAYDALWLLAARGIPLPPPAQHDYL